MLGYTCHLEWVKNYIINKQNLIVTIMYILLLWSQAGPHIHLHWLYMGTKHQEETPGQITCFCNWLWPSSLTSEYPLILPPDKRRVSVPTVLLITFRLLPIVDQTSCRSSQPTILTSMLGLLSLFLINFASLTIISSFNVAMFTKDSAMALWVRLGILKASFTNMS